MNEAQSIEYLKKSFHIRTDNKGLILLRSIKAMLQKADEEDRKKIGLIIIGFARLHNLKDKQLLKFFSVTMDEARSAAGEEFLKEHGLYRVLVASPRLSPMCELFFDAWFAASYEKNPFECVIRRVGNDAFRIVSILPDGKEVEYPEDMTAAQVLGATNCPEEELLEKPVLQ